MYVSDLFFLACALLFSKAKLKNMSSSGDMPKKSR